MTRSPTLAGPALIALIGAVLLVALLPASGASAASRVSGTPLHLLHGLATKAEHRKGYDRDLFPTWIDADHDGCDARDEVLIAETRAPVHVKSGCRITGGRWFSAYDGRWTKNPSTFDIDHLVPLKEAWDSGAWRWSAARRRAYANDLGSGRSLRAVSASSNRSKGDDDPAQWLPPRTAFRCTYAKQWVATKVRWHLSVNTAERHALHQLLAACPGPVMTVHIA